MRRIFSRVAPVVALLLTAAAAAGSGQSKDTKRHRIVFEVTGEAASWESVLNNVENAQTALGAEATEIRVVAHGRGLGLVLQANSAMAERIARISSPQVKFAACENSMRRMKVVKEDLLPAVVTVDSGVAEVVRLQEAGWSYLKSGS